MGRKSRLFAHSLWSPDFRIARHEAEIADSLAFTANIRVLGRLSAETGSIRTAAQSLSALITEPPLTGTMGNPTLAKLVLVGRDAADYLDADPKRKSFGASVGARDPKALRAEIG